MTNRILLLLGILLPSTAFAAAPTATSGSSTLNEDTSINITLRASDPERQAMTYEIVTAPTKGTVSLAGNIATYRPSANLNGSDSFTWRAKDTTNLYSNTATQSLTITAVNDAPTTASTVSASGTEDNPVTINFTASDVDSSTLTWSVTVAPTVGTVSMNATTGVATYTPPANWSGSTSFKYNVSDGALSAGGTATITIAAVNDPPTASNVSLTTNESTAGSVGLVGADVDSSSLTYSIVSGPSHGTASISTRTLTYTPTNGWWGTDTITYKVNDGSADSNIATVSITVNKVNDPPTATSTSVTTAEDTPVTLTLTGSDPDGDPLTFVADGTPSLGTVSITSAGVATFTPTANAYGSGRFSFRAYDGTVYSAAATVTVTITSVNDAPVASPASATMAEDGGTASISLTATDADADFTYFTLNSAPSHGTATVAAKTASYTPAANFSGTDTFTVTATDGTAVSAPVTVTVTVTEVNDPPTAWSTAAMTDGRAIEITLHADDPDSPTNAPTLATMPTHGTASIAGSVVTYEPDAGYIGADTFTWAVNDGTTTSTASIRVSSVGTPGGAYSGWGQFGSNGEPFYADVGAGGISSVSTEYSPEFILGDLYDMGMQTYRQLHAADVTWDSTEQSEGAFLLEDSEALFAIDEIEPRFTLFAIHFASPTPPWATTTAEFQKQMGPEAYAYLDEVMNRVGDQTRYWELGNEMFHWVALDDPSVDPSTIDNLPASYPTDGYSPEEQAEFLRDAANYIRARYPDAIIVLPSVLAGSTATDEWLERVVAYAGSDWFDVVTYHSYDPWYQLADEHTAFEAEIAALGLGDKLVQLTETGSSAYPTQTAHTDYPNSEETQAADVFRRIFPGFAGGDSSAIWHTYREFTVSDPAEFGGFGLTGSDSTPRLAAYTAQLLASELLPIVQVTRLSNTASGMYAYEVRSLDGSVHWVAWGEGSLTTPAGMTEVTSVVPDTLGVFSWTSAGSTIPLSDTPKLLR